MLASEPITRLLPLSTCCLVALKTEIVLNAGSSSPSVCTRCENRNAQEHAKYHEKTMLHKILLLDQKTERHGLDQNSCRTSDALIKICLLGMDRIRRLEERGFEMRRRGIDADEFLLGNRRSFERAVSASDVGSGRSDRSRNDLSKLEIRSRNRWTMCFDVLTRHDDRERLRDSSLRFVRKSDAPGGAQSTRGRIKTTRRRRNRSNASIRSICGGRSRSASVQVAGLYILD